MTDEKLSDLCYEIDDFLFKKIITERNDASLFLSIVLGRLCVIAHASNFGKEFNDILLNAAATKIDFDIKNTEILH